jgi:DNA-binding CsgD family transcriptional regulator
MGVDHVALAVSRPGTLFDYEWLNTSLPEAFLGHYPEIAEHDFVRCAVALHPNVVLRDQEMIARRALDRHVVYQHARTTGANLEQVMAVMLVYGREWSSGLSLYRSRRAPFTRKEAQLLQAIVPQIANAVQNCRKYGALRPECSLAPVLASMGLAVLWVNSSGREFARSDAATAVLEQWFPEHERRGRKVPEPLLQHLRVLRSTGPLASVPRSVSRAAPLCRLTVTFVPLEDGCWALVFSTRGIAPELQERLTPRLREIAGYVLRGMSNQQIATHDKRALATIKQQVGDLCNLLGVENRKGLLRVLAGLDGP